MSADGSSSLRELLRRERQGVLATLSARRDGWPFASVTLYALSSDGQPLLLLSELAEHTRNVRADARASLLVQESVGADEDPQALGRVTVLGRMGVVADDALDSARKRFVERHPQTAEYFALGDFHLWQLDIAEARFVNGFGDMGWLSGEKLRSALV